MAPMLVALIASGGPAGGRVWADDPGVSPGRQTDVPRLSLDVSGGRATSLFGGVTDPGRGTFQVALHAHLPLLVREHVALDYTAGLVPVEMAKGTRVSVGSEAERLQPKTVFGAGLDGLGFTLRLRGNDRWQPYLCALGGLRYFEEPVPNPRGTRFNFSADVGGGVAVRVASRRWLTAALSLHHLSNGGLGDANPSFNGLSLTLGFAGGRKESATGALDPP